MGGGRSSCLPYFELQRPFFQPAWHVELVELVDINREEIRQELTRRQIQNFQISGSSQHGLLLALTLMLVDLQSIVDGIFALQRRIITIEHRISQLQGFVPLIPTHWARVIQSSIASKSLQRATESARANRSLIVARICNHFSWWMRLGFAI